MLTLKTTGKFKKDYKRMKSQGKDMSVLQNVIETLLMEKPLDIKHRDHSLSGKYIGFRECHITPNWLLIYATDHKQLILTAIRTGTHSDLFDE